MSTFTQIYYHIIYSTKHRQPTLTENHRERLFRYMWGILEKKNCHLYRIGGTDDHVHILTSVHPSVALADLVRDVKTSTTGWIKDERIFSGFRGWQDGYGAFTKSHADKDTVIEYIKRQKEHHASESFLDEFKRLLCEEGVDFEEKYLE